MRSALVLATAAMLLAAPVEAQFMPKDAALKAGRQYSEWFFTSQVDSLWAHMSDDMKEGLGNPATIAEHLARLVSRAGTEVDVMEEKMVMRNGKPQYWRTSTYTMASEPIQLRWVIVENGAIAGVGMNPLSQAPPVDPEP